MRDHLRQTNEYASHLAETRNRPEPVEPDPIDVLMGLVIQSFFADVFTSPVVVEVSLKTSGAPHQTNGNWDEEKLTTRWSLRLNRSPLPQVALATWSEANAYDQIKRFGGVVLSGQALFDHCIWYASLADKDRAEWDAMTPSLSSEVDWLPIVMGFEFSNATPAAERSKQAIRAGHQRLNTAETSTDD